MKRASFALAAAMMTTSVFATPSLIPLPRRIVEQKGKFAHKGDLNVMLSQVKHAKDATVPKEGYRLTITTNSITIVSSDAAGKDYAVKTLRQLAYVSALGVQVPCMEIEDSPSYSWRGVHLDECRHFFGSTLNGRCGRVCSHSQRRSGSARRSLTTRTSGEGPGSTARN